MAFCSAILSKFLDQYIQKFDKTQINSSLLNGHIELSNISFTQNLLTSFGIPLLIKESRVGQIVVDFPMKANKNANFRMINLDIYTTIDWSALNDVSINSVADLVQLIKNEKKANKADKRKAWNSWIEKVIDNAKIEINNVRLHIEFKNNKNQTSLITIRFQSLIMNTINSKGEIVIHNNKPEILTKRIKLTSFMIGLHTKTMPFQSFEKLNNIEYNLLNPCSFTFTMIHNRKKSSISNTFIVVFDPISFELNQDQYFALHEIFNDFSKSQIRQKFQSCMRPSIGNDTNEIEMWNYLNRCAIKIRHPHKFSPKIAINFLKLRHKFASDFMGKKNRDSFVKKSIKNFGENLTFLLVQYSSILIRREERRIQLDEKEIVTISKDDIPFFTKNSFHFELTIQGICIQLRSFFALSINNINCLYEKNGENFTFNFEVQNCFVNDFKSNCKVIQSNKNENNFIQFRFNSNEDVAIFAISKIKFDIRSSFLKHFCDFFVDYQNSKSQEKSLKNNQKQEEKLEDETNVKSSSINQYLLMINPKTFIKFRILIKGISIDYLTENEIESKNDDDDDELSQHSFNCEINQIELQNFSKESKDTVLNIVSIMRFGKIKVDDLIISEEFSLQSSTIGIIDKYYFLGDIVTKLDILNATICVDSQIIDKMSNILSSIMNNTQRSSTKVYSSHKIYANCSSISFLINTGFNALILSISEVGLHPSIEFRKICILEKDKQPKIQIPSLCFDKWPTIETELINIKLNSYDFFDLLDEVNWITSQITKITSSLHFENNEEEGGENKINKVDNDYFNLIAHCIDYKMGDRANSMKFKNAVLILNDDFNIKIDSLSLFDSDNKQFVSCNDGIKLIMKSTEEKNVTSVYLPNLKMNFLWNETNQIIDYFQDSRDLIEQNRKTNLTKSESSDFKKTYEICVDIKKSIIDIENSFNVLLDELKFDYLISEKSILLFKLNKIDIDNLLEVNNFIFQINDFIYDISISSINANLSQTKATKISKLSFIPSILKKQENKKPENESKSNSLIDMNVNINNFTFIESSTKLTLTIPIIKLTLNSYNSIGAVHIPLINFEKVAFNDIELFLLYNSIDFNYKDINSIFLLERKKLINNTGLKLTNLIVHMNSIELDYAHYFVMRIFNAYKIYSKYALFSDNQSESSNISISAKINQIIIKEHNLSDPISLFGLSFEQNIELIEFKCNSINCIKFIEMRNEEQKSEFFVLQKNSLNTNLKVNPIDVYININTINTLTYIYESLSSLIKTEFEEKLSKKAVNVKNEEIQTENKAFNFDLSDIQIHLPFEDDPSFKNHGLIISFNLIFNFQENSYKLLNLTHLKMFFKNYKRNIEFLPLIDDLNLLIKLHDFDLRQNEFDYSLLEIEIGNININLSSLDIFELQLIVNNLRKSFVSLFNPKTYSIPDVNKEEKIIFTIKESKIKINPISISLCEENRSSNIFKQILTLCIETENENTLLKIQNDIQLFSMDLIFTITHMNSYEGKLEMFMPTTSLSIKYSKRESNTSNFLISIKKGIEFNLTPSSFKTLIKFIRKFKNKDTILLLKNESKYNYKSNYWIQNNLDSDIIIEYEIEGEVKLLFAAPNDNLPICEYNEDKPITFKYKEIHDSFNPKNILFPTYFNNSITISKIASKNYIKSIEFNSPLSIQNKLDFKIIIFIKEDKKFIQYASLFPKSKFPLPFEEKQYFIIADFQSLTKQKMKHKKTEKVPQIDQNNLPEIFTLSLNKSPKIIKIKNYLNNNSISFVLNVNDDYQTNTRIYEIIPSFFIKNLMSFSAVYKIYNSKDNSEITEESILLKIQEKKQINFFNHDIQSFLISIGTDSFDFDKKTLVKLDKENEIFVGSDNTAIQVKKSLKTDQKQIVVFKPCVIFNKTTETIHFSPSNSPNSKKTSVKDFAFYGLESYTKSENSMKIDISVDNSEVKKEAIDCMRLNSNCTTVYLTRIDNHKLFYPLNCSITLGDFPMNATHVVTFTHYLYVINNLPFDFSLVPVTSDKVSQINSNFNNIEPLLNEIESESQFLLKDCFYVVPCSKSESNRNENRVLINCVPKDSMFLFSVSTFPDNPIIQLNSITRTIFMIKNRREIFYIEINIYEDKSTLYAYFQLPSFPVPLTINNSLKNTVFVYQNIKPNKNKLMIHSDSSSLFAFTEPFINSKELRIEILKNDDSENKEFVEFLFSMEEQLSPLISVENNIIISTTIISKNNSKMIQIRYLDEKLIYKNSFRVLFSVNSLIASLKNEISEIALFSMKNFYIEACQDDRNTFLNLSIESIQIDNQSPVSSNPVCLVGTGKNLLKMTENENEKEKNNFFNLLSIFPRGVPIFSAISFMSIQIQPIFIVPETSLIFNLSTFIKELVKNSDIDDQNYGSMVIEPSFNSVNVNKTLIAYFEISPINAFIQIPTEKMNESFLKIAAMKFLNMISLSKFSISIPKLFASEFNNNFSYLFELYRNFYGNEIMNQISKNTVIKIVASSLIRFKKLKFVPLSLNSNLNTQNLCDNRKPIFGYFNEIELNDLYDQTNFYFNQTPDVINQLVKKDISALEISSFDDENQKNPNQTENRFIIGIKNDSINPNTINYNSNSVDLIQVFQTNEIKRIRIPLISPIYSSFDDQQNEPETQNKEETSSQIKANEQTQNNEETNSKIEMNKQTQDKEEPNTKIESNEQTQNNEEPDSKIESSSQKFKDESDVNESNLDSQNESKNNEHIQINNQSQNEYELQSNDELNSQDEIKIEPQNETNSNSQKETENQPETVNELNTINVIYKKNPAEIYLKIQAVLLRDKKLENQNIKFLIESKMNDFLYCVTDEVILILLNKNDDIQIHQKVEISKIKLVSSDGKTVSLKCDYQKIDQIDIQFNREEDARTLLSYIDTQQKIFGLFGHAFYLT